MTTLTALIAELEAVEEGSRELDADLAEASGNTVKWEQHGDGSQTPIMWEGARWIIVPHHSSSLDAKLPGENITHIACQQLEGFWQATHEGPGGLEDAHIGLAKTEPLARRLAALKAMADA